MNNNKILQGRKEFWDAAIPEIIKLVTLNGYRMKDLAKHYNCCVNTISSALYRRKIGLISVRRKFAKEQGE